MRASVIAASSLLLAACSGGAPLLGGGLAPYQPSNSFMPVGYSEEIVGPDQYRVRASGTDTTPYERVEKIATARAAEIGAGMRKDYFKITGVRRDFACSKKKEGYKVPDTAASARPTVSIDVVYSTTAGDAQFLSSKDTFARLSAELLSDTYPEETQQAAARDVRAKCGA